MCSVRRDRGAGAAGERTFGAAGACGDASGRGRGASRGEPSCGGGAAAASLEAGTGGAGRSAGLEAAELSGGGRGRTGAVLRRDDLAELRVWWWSRLLFPSRRGLRLPVRGRTAGGGEMG